LTAQQQPPAEPETFRFKSGVELINVTATVSDFGGRFVSGLRSEDFAVYEDDQPVQVTHFSAERVPVSLGIALDTSGSMAGEKIQAARSALDRFLYDLLGPNDEMFLYRFANDPILLQSWTTDRQLLSRALGRITPNGGTAMYDTVAEAIPLAQRGQNVKKALVLISDGNDTASRSSIVEVKQLIRESEVLVYAIGIDGSEETTMRSRTDAGIRSASRSGRAPIGFARDADTSPRSEARTARLRRSAAGRGVPASRQARGAPSASKGGSERAGARGRAPA
jgi:VWFA-related protein